MIDKNTRDKNFSENIIEFLKFVRSLTGDDTHSDVMREFTASIYYKSEKQPTINATGQVLLKLKDYNNEGNVDIVPSETFVANNLHLTLTASYQKYEFDERSKSLKIIGTSAKLGEYSIEIAQID